MANICYNVLTVQGAPEKIAAFVKRAATKPPDYEKINQDLYFGAFLLPKDGENRTGLWGCKWEADDVNCSHTDGTVVYSFCTPWGPPDGWLQYVVEEYPELTFKLLYEEGGCSLYGVLTGEEGAYFEETLEEEQYLERYNEDYCNEKTAWEEEDYETLINKLHEHEDVGELVTYYRIQKYIAKRIKIEDIPTVINNIWDDDALEILNQNLKRNSNETGTDTRG